MKRFIAALCIGLLPGLLLGGCRSTEKPPLLVSQTVAVKLQPEAHSLDGTSTFSFVRRGSDLLRLRLAPHAAVLSVHAGEHPVPWKFSDGTLNVPLSAIPSDNQFSIAVRYRAVFNDKPKETASFEDPTFGVTAVIGSEGIFLGDDAGWYPIAEPLPKEMTISVTVPRRFRTVTEGVRVEERSVPEGTLSVWTITTPGERLSLSAGPYHLFERSIDGITVATYLFLNDPDLSKTYIDAAVEYLRFYQGVLGPYPYKKFAVVENFLPTGYGFSSYTLIGSSVLRLPFIPHTSLPHEIVHCWWGNGVRVDYRGGNWSEGLTTYLADYFLEERKSPRSAVEYRRKILDDYASLVSPAADFPLRQFTGRTNPASRSIGYGKAAMVFHMTRVEIGDKAFFQGLRNLIQDKLHQEASWGDFARTFSATSGRDLTPFFTQWLDRPGGPRLSFSGVAMKREGTTWRVTGEVLQSASPYAFPLSIRLETDGTPVTITVPVKSERTPFSITSGIKPVRLLLDPDVDVFRLLSSKELPLSVNRVKGARGLLVVRSDSCRAERETLKLLLNSIGKEQATITDEGEVEPAMVEGHDLLLCGVPRHKELMPRFGDSLTIGTGSFTVGTTQFSSPEDALFAVGTSGSAKGGVTAIFHPLSPGAAREAAPKITHYGKYGYLVFNDGKNSIKGSFPADAGGAAINLTEMGL